MINKNELRIGNFLDIKLNIKKDFIDDDQIYPILLNSNKFKIGHIAFEHIGLYIGEEILMFDTIELIPIPITPENIEKYIDWSFEFNFNKTIVEEEFYIKTWYLLDNIIDGSGNFEIVYCKSKTHGKEFDAMEYLIDGEYLEFGLDDNLHNLQNLFYISTGQELPIKQNAQ